MVELESGKCYLVKYKLDPARKNAKVYETRVHILEIQQDRVITNHRPWGEGGTGYFSLNQIVEATEIPRGPVPR